jgi:hypothetical protein
MTAHVSTKSRRVGLPAEAVICLASELTYDAHHFGPSFTRGSRFRRSRGISQSIRLRFRCSMSARQPTRPEAIGRLDQNGREVTQT